MVGGSYVSVDHVQSKSLPSAELDWICLTTTRCLHALKNLLKPYLIVQVWGLDEVNKFHQIGGDSSDELYRISDHSY